MIDKQKCEHLGLDFDAIQAHQMKLSSLLIENEKINIKIKDTCRIENGGVIKLSKKILSKLKEGPNSLSLVAFVPAAGASSRFIGPFGEIVSAIDCKDRQEIHKEFLNLFSDKKSQEWFLFPEIKHIAEDPSKVFEMSDSDLDRLKSLFSSPKALYPCNKSGTSFFEIKLSEHKCFESIKHQVFIVPPGRVQDFSQLANQDDISFLEQGNQLSTIRFAKDCQPHEDAQGNYSIVPAGHGALIGLFAQAAKKSHQADAFFIRNSDNISGDRHEVVEETKHFFDFYQFIFNKTKQIREELQNERVENANEMAISILELLGYEQENDVYANLIKLQKQVFNTPEECFSQDSLSSLQVLYDRPVNILGVVPNNGSDVGGTPVFAQINGQKIKVCIEVPHASIEDKKTFLENPKLATHFNPVFVLAEATKNTSCYDSLELPFWLMAKKQWNGKDAFYYETILYEILGNSVSSNLIFVEIPRFLFNPNKTLDDCVKNADLINHM